MRSEVILQPYRSIEKLVLGHALNFVQGGSWRVGSTLNVSIHIQRMDREILAEEMGEVMTIIALHNRSRK